MWRVGKFTRVTVTLLAVLVLVGSILAHSAHSFHIHKHAKAVADVADAYTLRTNSSVALASTEFTLPAPEYLPGLLLNSEAVPLIRYTRIEVSGSRAPPRES